MFMKSYIVWILMSFLIGALCHAIISSLIAKAKKAEIARRVERKKRLRALLIRRALVNRARRRKESDAKLRRDRTDDTLS